MGKSGIPVQLTQSVVEYPVGQPVSTSGPMATVLNSVARLVLVHSAPAALGGFRSKMLTSMHFVLEFVKQTMIAVRPTCVPTSDNLRPSALLVKRALMTTLFLGLINFSAGCDDACTALAKQICACEPNRALQLSCEDSIAASSNISLSTEESEVCEQKLDTCTCARLEDKSAEDLQACGLAK